jgi:hypothetical protein
VQRSPPRSRGTTPRRFRQSKTRAQAPFRAHAGRGPRHRVTRVFHQERNLHAPRVQPRPVP